MSDRNYTLAQQEAIDWNDGPLLVIAGPGSGKTAVLTQRISRVLREAPDDSFKVLALTFTNKAALEMSERIMKLVPDAKGRLFIGTFHSFCAEVLRNHGSSIGIKPDFSIFSDENDLKAIISDLQNEYFSEFGDEKIYDLKLLNAIQYFQKKLCYSEQDVDYKMPKTQFADIFKWVYINYQRRLLSLNVLDFNSMVMFAYQLFKNNAMVSKLYRISYKYICVDEFQDTNLAQYELIKIISSKSNKNLFIVADDDQVIYGWNGASNQRIIDFKDEFEAQVIQLSENFRCPQEVVHLANILIANNAGRVSDKSPLVAMKGTDSTNKCVELMNFVTLEDELNWVSESVKKIRSNENYSTIGIIARNNKIIQKQFEVLRSNNVAAVKSKRKDEFENPFIRWIHYCLKLANRRNDERLLSEVVNCYKALANEEINIEEMLSMSKTYGDDLLSGFYECIKETSILAPLIEEFKNNLVDRINFIGFIDHAFQWADEVITKTSIDLPDEFKLDYSADYTDEKKVWNSIYQQLKNNYGAEVNLSTFLQEFSMVSKEPEPQKTDVQCLTVHASKGKEFDYVFVIGMVEDELPSFQSKKNGDTSVEMEEERRNCFVAITRTMQKLTLTYSDRYFGWKKKPSRFLYEMQLLK